MNTNEHSQALRDSAEGIRRITTPITRDYPRRGRNESCWCDSGKKYKKCCWVLDQEYIQRETLQAVPNSLEEMSAEELLDVINEGEGDE